MTNPAVMDISFISGRDGRVRIHERRVEGLERQLCYEIRFVFRNGREKWPAAQPAGRLKNAGAAAPPEAISCNTCLSPE